MLHALHTCEQLQHACVPPCCPLSGIAAVFYVLMQSFEATAGYQEFEQRRRTKYNKNIATGVSMGNGLQEGIDRQLKPVQH